MIHLPQFDTLPIEPKSKEWGYTGHSNLIKKGSIKGSGKKILQERCVDEVR